MENITESLPMEQKEENPPKKNRQRKKQLYKNILQLMEFYFSDSNLSKDRLLSELVSQDPFIDLHIFLKCNKIRKLTENIVDIQKAVSKSEMLELSEDKAKIRRKTPFVPKENVDDCTIYVERLNSDATHEWLTSLFSEFGKVTYVSIPKYKNNGMVKGFAFIEFEDPKGVENTVNFFEKIGCKIPSNIEPQNLCSIITYESDEKGTDKTEKDSDSKDTESGSLKRVHSDNDMTANKKLKLDNNEQSVADNDTPEEETVKKKKKKSKNKNNIEELGLQILTKKEWKKMRNNYLNLQRKKMKELKEYLSKQHFNRKENKNCNQINSTTKGEAEKPNSKDPPAIEFKEGLIVKIILPEPYQSAKTLKNELKSHCPEIVYVDMSSENEEIFVRFSEPEHAKQFCTSSFDGECSILKGTEEKSYWEKIMADRNNKRTKNIKRQRGRDKLLKRAEKVMAQHVRFDDL